MSDESLIGDDMGQLGNLIKHELIGNLTSGRYILTSIVCIVLCVTSIVLMSRDYRHREKQSNLARGISIPPQPLSLLAKGTNEIRPVIPNFHPRYNVIGQVFIRFGDSEFQPIFSRLFASYTYSV